MLPLDIIAYSLSLNNGMCFFFFFFLSGSRGRNLQKIFSPRCLDAFLAAYALKGTGRMYTALDTFVESGGKPLGRMFTHYVLDEACIVRQLTADI